MVVKRTNSDAPENSQSDHSGKHYIDYVTNSTFMLLNVYIRGVYNVIFKKKGWIQWHISTLEAVLRYLFFDYIFQTKIHDNVGSYNAANFYDLVDNNFASTTDH